MKSALELIRQRAPSTHLAKSCWHMNVPLKMSIFLWKLTHNALPTDHAIQREGNHYASKCLCCPSNSSIEFNNHLFIASNIAKEVWSFFSNLLQVEGDFLTINHLLSICYFRSKSTYLYSWLLKVLPICIFWNIWKARNYAKFEDQNMNSYSIIDNIWLQISHLSAATKLQLPLDKTHFEAKLFFWINYSRKRIERAGRAMATSTYSMG